jgi:RNA polymerase sigma-70 factor (ECF subfamily)
MSAKADPVLPRVPSFGEVYDAHFDFVWRCVANRGVPRSAVDDIVQEVFMVVHRRLAAFESRSSLRTWLWVIVRRVARDHVRKIGNAAVGEPLGDRDVAIQAGPAEALEQKSAAELLDELMGQMTEAQREVFMLYEVEQMTGSEIAAALSANENTIYSRLRAARRIFESGVARYRASLAEEQWTR